MKYFLLINLILLLFSGCTIVERYDAEKKIVKLQNEKQILDSEKEAIEKEKAPFDRKVQLLDSQIAELKSLKSETLQKKGELLVLYNKEKTLKNLKYDEVLQAVLEHDFKNKFQKNRPLIASFQNRNKTNQKIELTLKSNYQLISDEIASDEKIIEPFREVQYLAQTSLNKLGSEEGSFNPIFSPQKPKIEDIGSYPPEVPVIIPPKKYTLNKKSNESEAEFEKRKIDAKIEYEQKMRLLEEEFKVNQSQRELKIAKLNQKYSKALKEYREKIAILETIYKRNKLIVNDLKDVKLQQKDIFQDLVIQNSFLQVMGGLEITDMTYNPQNYILTVTISAKNTFYERDILFENIDQNKADEIILNRDSLALSLFYTVNRSTVKSEDNPILKIGLEQLTGKFKGQEFNEKIKVAYRNQNNSFSNFSLQNQISAVEQENREIQNLLSKFKPTKKDPKKWLFAVGVEDYSFESTVSFSTKTTKDFFNVAKKVFGIKDRNAILLVESDSNSGVIQTKLDHLLEDVKDGDIIYFYYSGHGIPAPDGTKAYILAKDQSSSRLSDDFEIQKLYKRLSDSKASKVFAFVESCYSGKLESNDGKKNILKGIAAGAIKPVNVTFDKNKMAVFTAAGSNQFANEYFEKGYRMFSYFLMKELLKGEKNLENLSTLVEAKVYETSDEKGRVYRQKPELDGNRELVLY